MNDDTNQDQDGETWNGNSAGWVLIGVGFPILAFVVWVVFG